MLESTGSHGRGVERRVPEMRRMVEFNCTSTVPLTFGHSNAKYSAIGSEDQRRSAKVVVTYVDDCVLCNFTCIYVCYTVLLAYK